MNAPVRTLHPLAKDRPLEKLALSEQIEFRNVTKLYGQVIAVRSLSLTVGRGEFLTILGPSGSGKTTTLMLLAGFEAPTEGDIRIAGKSVASVPSYRRDQGVVFQSYALFPHLTVRRNLEFPLEMRGIRSAERAARAERILSRVHLDGLGDRMPSQLSGGQQQRVALARALIADPPILLLDEPLGALDRNLREQMQGEIKGLHKEFGITTVCVTHDQEEALTLSDRIVVMNAGRIEQTDTPEALYDRPVSRFVANFLGDANILDDPSFAVESDTPQPDGTVAMIRPERIRISAPGATKSADADQRQHVAGTVTDMIYAGPLRRYHVAVGDNDVVIREHVAAGRQIFQIGDTIQLDWLRSDIRFVTT
ncbi:ATP-binding cassette domain-containing protein [Mesorhizobium sp. M2A.F.Ca.ET.037.01.1.1]|uniref:ABC transporter ATP-binding protein n=1 Tax=unclassified Mesorhizobium TaxID=325217 RepID=UPI000F7640CA|nr:MULTISPECIES: ABC transporter ATP-binding protein [unclassified Mesorhizobium]RUV52875.1 ATP-binding cassette domain-containing protein [Mesorhizobium sp. M7A.F.Ca.MR.228.00.0.0]RVC70750.1 ATP-binding cassette domain-containing protein [Mesorhizobium sp. M00.F.Ca.ET.038.03.1.1]AZO36003.1 ABC transporter ATP-binding protein [Mesorhizobium sp. M2A.F.Ca.ET.046.03.2.1]AZO73062.1 ABC transporter ATP-binding protein [Mesorhizobium sp. M1D.F.Ca.ET.043.01.1.1]RUV17547.1 ATP-binding cassette domain-